MLAQTFDHHDEKRGDKQHDELGKPAQAKAGGSKCARASELRKGYQKRAPKSVYGSSLNARGHCFVWAAFHGGPPCGFGHHYRARLRNRLVIKAAISPNDSRCHQVKDIQ